MNERIIDVHAALSCFKKDLAAGPGTRADVPAEECQQQRLTIPTLGPPQQTEKNKGMS